MHLPEVEHRPPVIEMERARYVLPLPSPEEELEEARVPLSQYLWILKRYRWRILGFCAAAVLATLAISYRLTPIYEATVTIDIDRQMPSDVVGQDSARNALNDADQFVATQMKLVESDSVLRPVDEKLGLRRLERRSLPGSPLESESAPVKLKRLRVTRPPNTYLMLIHYRSEDPQLAADAANEIAQSYLEHTYNIRVRSSANMASFMERQIEELRAKMERSGMALAAFERDLHVVNPDEKTNILAARLLQLNTDYTAAQTERLKKQAAYESVKGGSLEAALAAPQGEPLRRLAERVNGARERVAEARVFYGSNHPEFRRALATLEQLEKSFEATRAEIARQVEVEFAESARREQMAAAAVAEVKAEYDALNARSFDYQALKREAEADKALYDQLVRKIKEAGINAGFHNSAIRIADPARPPLEPVWPNIPLNALLALLFAALVGVGGAVLADTLDKTVRDPEQVARTLRAEVIGSLPRLKGRAGMRLLAQPETPEADGFHESIRAIRNSILLANFERRYRSLLITSAAPGEGKTTTALHLAQAHAEQGQRTLLIDGDLRRPSVHRRLGVPSAVGLSNVLLGEIPWLEAVTAVEGRPGLEVLPAGRPSRRASDLVGRGLAGLIEAAMAEYDLVVLDAPPLLGFAEPMQMAIAVDGVVVVARAGQTSRKAVATVLATLNRLRAKLVGLVLNEVHKELSESYHYYGYYGSYYGAPAGKEPEAHQEAGA